MNKFKTSRKETQKQRTARLQMIESNPILVKTYTTEELKELRDKFSYAQNEACGILFDAYIEFLELVGIKPNEACEFADDVDSFKELFPWAEKFEAIDRFFWDLTNDVTIEHVSDIA